MVKSGEPTERRPRLTLPELTPAKVKPITWSPQRATSQRSGREKAIWVAFQRMDRGKLRPPSSLGNSSASTCGVGWPLSATVATR